MSFAGASHEFVSMLSYDDAHTCTVTYNKSTKNLTRFRVPQMNDFYSVAFGLWPHNNKLYWQLVYIQRGVGVSKTKLNEIAFGYKTIKIQICSSCWCTDVPCTDTVVPLAPIVVSTYTTVLRFTYTCIYGYIAAATSKSSKIRAANRKKTPRLITAFDKITKWNIIGYYRQMCSLGAWRTMMFIGKLFNILHRAVCFCAGCWLLDINGTQCDVILNIFNASRNCRLHSTAHTNHRECRTNVSHTFCILWSFRIALFFLYRCSTFKILH